MREYLEFLSKVKSLREAATFSFLSDFPPGGIVYYMHGLERRCVVIKSTDHKNFRLFVRGKRGREYWINANRVFRVTMYP